MSLHFASLLLSLLPVAVLEWLLTTFAYLQLLILSAKGVQSKEHGQDHGSSKRRKKKKKKRSMDVGMTMTNTAAKQQQQFDQEQERQHPQQSQQQQQQQGPPIHSPIMNTEVDVLGDSILFESNERHRREFEGFLRSVKDIKDVNNWLKNFSNEAPRKVAIVKISRRILETDYGTAQAASALSFMFKFGLYPIVVHGGWNELSRDTITEVVARRVSFSQKLKAEIRKCGVGAAILTHDVCLVEPAIHPSTNPFKEKRTLTRGPSLGFVTAVGEGRRASLHMEGGLGFQVNEIDSDRLIAYLEKGKIPIWDGVAVNTDGTEIPLNGDVTTVELAHLLHPYRIIFACNDGGILDKNNKPIPVVYMDRDYDELMSASWVSQRRKIQVLQLRRIVSVVPSSCSVVVTHIDAITHQLMYPRLANETIIKRAEENTVHVIEDVNRIDKEKLKAVIEDSFGRPLAPDYLDNLGPNLYRIYLVTGMDGEYNGCAVIMRGVYMDHTDYFSHNSHDTHHDDGDHDPHNYLMPDPHDADPANRIHENRRHMGLNRSQNGSEDLHAHHGGNAPKSTDSDIKFQVPTIEVERNNDSSSTVSSTDEFHYLCKFCVRKSAQGAGLGDLLWRSLQRDIDRLYWRSRTNNPLNPWYYARCQGSFRTNGHFTVFWYGDDRFEDGGQLIQDALSKPATILPAPT